MFKMASFDGEEHLTEEMIEEFREAFALFDKNGDGEVQIEELVKTLHSLGQHPTQMEIDELVHEFDANGDGVIDFEEFKMLMYRKMKNTEGAEDIKRIFDCLDLHNYGYFTANELVKVILKLGETITLDEANELINDTATKEPGRVNYEEFCHLVKTLIGRH